MKKIIHFISLFTSLSTLACCALPALIISLGMGAAMAGFLSKYPQLIWLSENKVWLFLFGGICLLLGGKLHYRSKITHCPVGDLREACTNVKEASFYIYISSLVIYLVGFIFAYILPYFV